MGWRHSAWDASLKHTKEEGASPKAKGLRFCESCRSYQPPDNSPHRKGWRCTSCKLVRK